MRTAEIEILSAEYHRNGISGEPFYAIVFEDKQHGKMVASLFKESGFCAVYKIDLLAQGNVEFGENSWRGDVYEHKLRPALEEFKKKLVGND